MSDVTTGDSGDEEVFGPIDYVVVEFPDGKPGAEGFRRLLDVVDRGAIQILDLEIVVKDGAGVRPVDPAGLPDDALVAFSGASSGLLDQSDFDLLGAEMGDGSVAAIVVYEELSMLGVLNAWGAEGGRQIAAGQLTPADLVAALDATEPA